MEKYKKITVGFVVQKYEKSQDGKFICKSQEFVAGDDVSYENDNGEKVVIDTDAEIYQPMEMLQP